MSSEISLNDIRLQHPFTCVISGPTGSGKTVLLRGILQNWRETFSNLDDRDAIKVLWCYGEFQAMYNSQIGPNVKVSYIEGLPTEDELRKGSYDVVVVDDLMYETGDDKRLANMFTKGSHHMGYSLFYIVQNFFHRSKQMRTITLNAHYVILMKNRRDLNQIVHFGRQIFPNKPNFFLDVYNDATHLPFGYLLVDLRPETSEELRLRSNISHPYEGIVIYQFR